MTENERKVMQQALEAMAGALLELDSPYISETPEEKALRAAIKSLEAALAEPEPVGMGSAYSQGAFVAASKIALAQKPEPEPEPVTPPARRPLTDEEIDAATSQAADALLDHIYEYGTTAEGVRQRIRKLARAAIAQATGGNDE